MAIKKLDCFSELCPIPLLRTVKELKTMEEGDILLLYTNHSCVPIDVEKWAKAKNYPIQLIETGEGEWEIYIQKPKMK